MRGRYLKKITKKGKHMIINTEAEKVSQVLPKKLHKVWAVKSPQATYKTQSLKTVLPTDESVLLVGHRTILIRQICKEIGMDCYEDVDNDEYTNSERLGITYHSLHHLFNKHLEQDHEKFTKRNSILLLLMNVIKLSQHLLWTMKFYAVSYTKKLKMYGIT